MDFWDHTVEQFRAEHCKNWNILIDRMWPMEGTSLLIINKWNTLPVSLRTASSFLTFRRELKAFLFNISFPDNWTSLDIVKWPWQFFDSDTIILATYY